MQTHSALKRIIDSSLYGFYNKTSELKENLIEQVKNSHPVTKAALGALAVGVSLTILDKYGFQRNEEDSSLDREFKSLIEKYHYDSSNWEPQHFTQFFDKCIGNEDPSCQSFIETAFSSKPHNDYLNDVHLNTYVAEKCMDKKDSACQFVIKKTFPSLNDHYAVIFAQRCVNNENQGCRFVVREAFQSLLSKSQGFALVAFAEKCIDQRDQTCISAIKATCTKVTSEKLPEDIFEQAKLESYCGFLGLSKRNYNHEEFRKFYEEMKAIPYHAPFFSWKKETKAP